MGRCGCLKMTLASVMIAWLGLCCLGQTRVDGGWQLTVTFTTSSPGGDLKFDPQHVQVVWVETATGLFVKTIGRWGFLEHRNLAEWAAVDGTNIDGWTGATPKVYQEHSTTWNFTDRTGKEVPDGFYFLRFELTNHNAQQNQFNRTTVAFQKNGVTRSEFYPAKNGFFNITLDYRYVPTTIPEITISPATYVTGASARLNGRIIDTGGEDPNVYLYWGGLDGGTDARRWDGLIPFGQLGDGPVRADLMALEPSTEYYYRLYAENSAGGCWTDHTESLLTHGPTGFSTGYRVQSGRARVEGLRLDIDILPVNDTARAFALFSYGTGWQPDAENANVVMARGHLLDNDTISIERASGLNSTWVSWQVIECLNRECQVYRGSGQMKGAEISVDAPLNGAPPKQPGRQPPGVVAPPDVVVDPAMCMAYVTADTSEAGRTNYHQSLLTAYVRTNTTVRIERGAAGNSTVNYNWVVVEFDPAAITNIQHGSVSFSSASETAPIRRTIRPVNPDSSLLIYQTRTSVNGLAYSAVAGRLASADRVEFYQYTGTSGSRSVEYHVIDFGPSARAQRGQVDFSGDSSWFYADCQLLQPVDISRTMSFHGLSCNGTGDLYPRPFSTAEFTSENTLRIERQFPGQQSFIEWQVLELPAATFFATEPDIRLIPDALDFQATAIGAGPELTFEICNTGAADLQVHSLEFVGLDKAAYSMPSPPAMPFTVGALTGKIPVKVRFTPTSAMDYKYARLAVGSNDPDQPVVELSLSGTGGLNAQN